MRLIIKGIGKHSIRHVYFFFEWKTTAAKRNDAFKTLAEFYIK